MRGVAIAAGGVIAVLVCVGLLVALAGAGRRRVVPSADTSDGRAWTARRPLRIAMDANCLRTARTGVRTYADELIARFTRSDAPHHVTILRGPLRLPSSVRLFRMVNQVVYLAWLHLWLPLRLRAGRYDVLFSPEYLTPVWSPVATVVMFHDSSFLRRPQDYNRLWLAMFRRITLPAIRRADAVIVPSAYTASEVVAYGGVASERICVVPLGGPTDGEPLDVAPVQAERALARFGLRPGGYVLHVGVLERRKNLPTLVRAFAAWRAQPGTMAHAGAMKLVLAGQPGPRPDLDDRRAITETVRALGLDDAVLLTGHVSREERDALYTSAAMVAIPSVAEGFGIPVLEAFAARVPVLCSRATSLPEVAGEAALLFDPTSEGEITAAMERLAADTQLRAELVRAGFERVRLFTWERTASGTFAAFEDAVVHRYAPHRAGRQGATRTSADGVLAEPTTSAVGVPQGSQERH